MVVREFDLIVFGASAFTGQYVTEEVLRTAQKEDIKWAISGRNEEKLKNVLKNATEETGIDANEVPIVCSDLEDDQSLRAMTSRARIVLNIVGPYSLYGERVVRACIESGTHYLDITGETNFIEEMHCKYDKVAKQKGVYIINSCGLSTDLWLPYVRDRFEGHVNSVETFASTGGTFTFALGTWKSVLQIAAKSREAQYYRRRLFATGEFFSKVFLDQRHKLWRRSLPFRSDWSEGLFVKFGAQNESLTPRTLHYRYEKVGEKPIQFENYVDVGGCKDLVVSILFAAIFSVLGSFQWGRCLMEKYPKQFSFGRIAPEGPTREQVKKGSFKVTYVVKGWGPSQKKHPDDDVNDIEPPNERLVFRMKGPEPGYLGTSANLVQCAYTVLKESDKIPESGGALSPGAAFGDTGIYDRLKERGLDMYKVGHLVF